MFTYSLELVCLLAQQVLEEGVRVHVSLLQPTRDVVEGLLGAMSLKFIRQGEAFACLEPLELFILAGRELLVDRLLEGCIVFSRLFEYLVFALLHHQVGLGDHPVPSSRIW